MEILPYSLGIVKQCHGIPKQTIRRTLVHSEVVRIQKKRLYKHIKQKNIAITPQEPP